MIYILQGEDDFTIKETLSRIKEDCGGDLLGESNVTVFNGTKVGANELMAACNTISFLSPKRLIIVEGLLGRFEQKGKRGRGKNKSPELKEWEPLSESVMPESTILVLIENKLSKTNPLLKKLTPVAEVKECTPLDLRGKDLPNWLRTRIKKNGGEISPKALRLLIDLIGNNLWILSNEIDKLCLYAEGRVIEEDDINLLVGYVRESNIFQMVDAIVQRRLGTASRLMHLQLNEGSAPPYLLYMITRQFRLLIQVKALMEQKVPTSKIGNRIGVTSEYVLGKTLDQARGYPSRKLEETYKKLLITDLSIKTGRLEGELAMDLLLADLCK